ncbi:tRNA lysidine(34) synthetase TilS [Fundidesulfovibrio agrisoli]|uniref:tRNA lysidine(34) synthetase TilS n=1 Tax=Fundidesulfovibrio agrisoli TaxID=2922717 RepID=UPI001FAD996F|nr:tRNA lysidine(34) synthetase TilS [Fundidesulfovibrio agrisoli]
MALPGGLSALSPWSAHLCLRVERTLLDLAGQELRGQSVVLAVSGGLDSTALAAMLSILGPRLGLTLHAAHLDHGLRPDSAQDAAHCAETCAALDISCVVKAADIRAEAASRHTGLEDAGRRARYAWLEELRRETGSFAVLTAHQLDELAEDVIMRLLRGAGWPALGGMPAWDPQRRILRPLLTLPKEQLRRFLNEWGLAWRDDPSNEDRAFLRNRVRKDFVPLFIRENPHFLGTVAELWTQARIDESFVHDAVSPLIPEPDTATGERLLPGDTLKNLPKALRLRLYKRVVESLGPGQPLAAPLRALDEAWAARSLGKDFQFPGGKQAMVTRDGIVFIPGSGAAAVDTSPPEG